MWGLYWGTSTWETTTYTHIHIHEVFMDRDEDLWECAWIFRVWCFGKSGGPFFGGPHGKDSSAWGCKKARRFHGPLDFMAPR